MLATACIASSWYFAKSDSLAESAGNLLDRLGYTRFQIVEQGLIHQQTPPFPAREGIYVNYQFGHGTSGLFGKELRAVWLTRSAFMAQYYRLLVRDRLGLLKKLPVVNHLASRFSVSWYDMHAALTAPE